MTAAGAADIEGSSTRVEISSKYNTVPLTLGLTLQQLRTTMFAGGTGYTAADPLTVGDFTVGASKLTVDAATGAVATSTAEPEILELPFCKSGYWCGFS